MSTIRIFGLVISAIVFILFFFRLRKYESKIKADPIMLFIIGLSLTIISFFPSILNKPTDFFLLDNFEGGRIILLLILSNIFLWFFLLNERGKVFKYKKLFNKTLRYNITSSHNYKIKTHHKKKILVIIPSLNEEINLNYLLTKFRRNILGYKIDILIIDDGGEDNTKKICKIHKAFYLRCPVNMGGGFATNVGFDFALKYNYDYFITMDADGQHLPKDIIAFIKKFKKYDFVIGSRILGKMEMYSRLRYYGVILFGKVISLLIGQKLTDPASGFRGGKTNLLRKLQLNQDQYHTSEFIIKSSKHNLEIIEVPISIKKRFSGDTKKGKNIYYSLMFLKTIIKSFFFK